MKARLIIVLFAALWTGSVMGEEPSRPADVNTQINEAKNELKHLQDVWRYEEARYKRKIVNPKLEDAEKAISILSEGRGRILGMEESEIKRQELEVNTQLMNHWLVVRRKLDPNGGGPAPGDPNLSDTEYGKWYNAKLQTIKADIAKTEARIKALEDAKTPLKTATSAVAEPGVVPNLYGLKFKEASSALTSARLKGRGKFDNKKPPTQEELEQLIVIDQDQPPGTKLEVDKGLVGFTLSSKALPSDKPNESQTKRPSNGRYQLTAGKLGDLATLEWTNHTDGSAEVKVSSPFFMLLMIDEPVFKARWDGQKSAYVVDGSDLQSFMKATAKPRAPDGPGWNARITDVQSNLSFVITTQGSNLVLKMGGSYHAKGFHERVVDGVTERKPTNTDFPSKEHQDIELIAKPLAQ